MLFFFGAGVAGASVAKRYAGSVLNFSARAFWTHPTSDLESSSSSGESDLPGQRQGTIHCCVRTDVGRNDKSVVSRNYPP